MDIRERAAATVQWQPARNGIKYVVHGYARARGHVLSATHRTPAIGTILGAGPQKGGSQWLKALIDHPLISEKTGLLTLPQLDYQLTPPKRGFPAGTYVPGFYLTYDEYKALPQRHPHRVVYMYRDPRDLVVSGYWSAVKTHRVTHLEEVERTRDVIRSLPFDEGLLLLIDDARDVLNGMATWMDRDDPTVRTFRLEDNEVDYAGQVKQILDHIGVSLTDAEFAQVIADTDRSALQKKDLELRGDGESHYRVDRKTWRDVFKPEHHEAIERVAPGLVELLGYEKA